MHQFSRRALSVTRTIATAMAYISGLLFLLLAFYMTVDVTSRSLGGPFTGVADQFASFTLALGGTWAMARGLVDGTHVRIDVFMPLYSERIRSLLYIWSMAMVAIFAGVLAWQAWVLVGKSAARNALVPQSMIDIPLAVPQSLSAIGYSMLTVQAVVMVMAGLALLLGGEDRLQNRLESHSLGETA